MTIKNLYPSNRPTSVYNIVNGRPELPPAGNFTRASKATVGTITGDIVEVDNGVPRFSYDPMTKEFEGLMLEKGTTQCVQDNENTSAWVWGDVTEDGTILGLPAFKVSRAANSGDTTYCYLLNSMPSGKWTATFYVDFGHAGAAPEPYLGIYMYTAGGGYLPWSVTKDITSGSPTFGKPIITRLSANAGGEVAYIEEGWKEVAPDIFLISLKGVMQGGSTPSNQRLYISSPFAPYSNRIAGVGLYADDQPLFSSFITSTTRTRADESFSLTTTKNYNNGFSMLLDSETTTDGFIYRLKAGGTVGAELSNISGTLDWNVNGNSAAISGDYPQIGFVKGRVRTISSFTSAGDTVNPNYLYTKGLSFPTVGAPLANIDTLEFGVPQTLKAVYIWSGQLDPIHAVSVIKGESNIVPNLPIVSNKYSFVFNTDPESENVVTASIPTIIPTAVSGGMTVDWGDGSPIRPYNKGVVPTHDYPYPGQYRIQYSGNETWIPAGDINGSLTNGGFDKVNLTEGLGENKITYIDQWPPQYRTTASGNGFTGTNLTSLLSTQRTLTNIPPFKYSGITSIERMFYLLYSVEPVSVTLDGDGNKVTGTAWDFIPTNLPDCTNMKYGFYGLSYGSTGTDTDNFPQITTSDKLTRLEGTFVNMQLTEFPEFGLPFTDTSKVTNWNTTFYKMGALTTIGTLDTQSATDIGYMFADCVSLTAIPSINTSQVQTATHSFENCKSLTRFPDLNWNNCTIFDYTWAGCTNLVSFDAVPDVSNAVNLGSAWMNCESMVNPPVITLHPTDDVVINAAWQYCSAMTTFPNIDITNVTNLASCWMGCSQLSTFPNLNTSKVTNFNYAWRECIALVNFPQLDFSNGNVFYQTFYGANYIDLPVLNYELGRDFTYTWYANWAMTEFKTTGPLTQLQTFEGALYSCTALTTFPAGMFDTTANLVSTAFNYGFYNCAFTPASVENILVSLATNAAKGVNVGITLNLSGGTTSPRYAGSSGTTSDASSWTAATETAFTALIAAGWTITYNKYAGDIQTESTFYVLQDGDIVHFVDTAYPTESGMANQEFFKNENEAIARVLELDEDFFPAWDREENYMVGERVKFGTCIFRALQENDAKNFERPDLELNPDAEVATPKNRQARWVEVYDPFELNEEESDGRPVQRSA